jgi:hypothetical protein
MDWVGCAGDGRYRRFMGRLPKDDAEHDCEDHQSEADEEQPKSVAFGWIRNAGILKVNGMANG